jgi:hypothetical protein
MQALIAFPNSKTNDTSNNQYYDIIIIKSNVLETSDLLVPMKQQRGARICGP